MSDYTRDYQGKLYMYYLKAEDAGEYECSSPDGRTSVVRLRVGGDSQSSGPNVDDGSCRFNLFSPLAWNFTS